jgi:2-isopropylmalate synthase
MTARLTLYDTTLRDGAQTQGVQFTTQEKTRIATVLDALGLDYIEGGWPGANPTDSDFFAAAPKTRATMTAFGMTKRQGRSADNDDVLAAVLNAGTPAVCLVGKAHEFHVRTALGITLDENLENIRASFAPQSIGLVRARLTAVPHRRNARCCNSPLAAPCDSPRQHKDTCR